MPEKHLFEYAVIRIVPRVEREEFLNAGVVLFCKKARYLQTRISLEEARLTAFAPALDLAEVRAYLSAFERIAAGRRDAGVIATLDTPSRFRWLTATRSTVVQSSKVHPGFCSDLDEALNRLMAELVL
ncbi:MAG TPA: DUF3037 domain-containing protein [Chitinophagaceae bacterium]|jgi:hypothetical protein|nr:DUF3037 domain-containing protein [Chitinophagaceae bacterium]